MSDTPEIPNALTSEWDALAGGAFHITNYHAWLSPYIHSIAQVIPAPPSDAGDP